MNSRNAPLSPVSSVSGTDWSYPPPSKDGPYSLSNKNRGQLISPPNSAGSFEAMNGGFQPGPRSAGGPSPPPSIGRSSTATNIYARSETGSRYTVDEAQQDAILGEHYVALKQFLSATSRDGKPTLPPNKARDKLQRLTSVQFLELSTDVYDELRRREVSARRPSNAPANGGPPAFLLPQENFHPKRNQARQKLSSLGPPRFRDLATDVFCELERRIPRFIAQEVPRLGSPVSSYPPRGANRRRPSEASSSNTIVPNKSTMLEEDDDLGTLGDGDAYPIDNMSDGRQSKRSVTERSETDRKLIEDYESQVRELRDKLDGMEDVIKRKEDEMANMINGERSRVDTASTEKRAWDDARDRLERELSEARNRNASLQQELDRRENEELRRALEEQRQVTNDVRREANVILSEMRTLSQQSSSVWVKQSDLEKTIETLEGEVRDWRNRQWSAVVASVRKITKDIDDSAHVDETLAQQVAKLKPRVSLTANNLITASRNFAGSAGISPVSLLDAAASHLVSAVVELLRSVKIRPTPSAELDDDVEDTETPVDSAGFVSSRSTTQSQTPLAHLASPRGGGDGDDVAPDTREQALQLKEFLDNQTSLLVQTIQDLVTRIRDNAAIDQLAPEIEAISGLVQHVVARTAEALGGGAAQLTERLESGRERLLEAGAQGRELVREGNDTRSREWRMWTATLPPISFEIARETKELAQRIDRLAGIEDADDFS
ncbi:hypothetical protein P8C59_008025 [Phyllachora maydis]|uniref:GIT Spa2 homology (SHD) domain-containing protein n=1 Tax=Phyllachora maydis TaxID=1825666 RepID=A0AAD9IAY9_9PEZI|nr:hypothetical protein P8C59_008025 [Phyllachora maydis]